MGVLLQFPNRQMENDSDPWSEPAGKMVESFLGGQPLSIIDSMDMADRINPCFEVELDFRAAAFLVADQEATFWRQYHPDDWSRPKLLKAVS